MHAIAAVSTPALTNRASVAHTGQMLTSHRRAIARSRPPSRLAVACDECGLTIAMLAKELQIPASTLRMAHAGKRPISREKAFAVQRRLGATKLEWRFPATVKNWPKLKDSD